MFYIKNLPTWERVLRILVSIFALYYVYQNWGQSNLDIAMGVIGAMLAMTGMMGFCPMCAMVGRTLDKAKQ